MGAAVGSGTSQTFTITPTVLAGQMRALSYAPGNVVDLATNLLTAFSDANVTNNSTQTPVMGNQPVLQWPIWLPLLI